MCKILIKFIKLLFNLLKYILTLYIFANILFTNISSIFIFFEKNLKTQKPTNEMSKHSIMAGALHYKQSRSTEYFVMFHL